MCLVQNASKEENIHKQGILFFGTTAYSTIEATDLLREKGIELDAMRIKALPFNDEVKDFIDQHEQVYVVEQNRDAQFRTLLMAELDADPKKLRSVLNYNGMPITAQTIMEKISEAMTVKESICLRRE